MTLRRAGENKENQYGRQCAEFELTCYTFVKKLGLCLFAVFLPLWLLCRVTHPFVPTTKEMAAIVVIPRVANSESVQGLGEGIVDLAKVWMQELRPDTVKATTQAATEEVKAAVDDTVQKVKASVDEVKTAPTNSGRAE